MKATVAVEGASIASGMEGGVAQEAVEEEEKAHWVVGVVGKVAWALDREEALAVVWPAALLVVVVRGISAGSMALRVAALRARASPATVLRTVRTRI